MNQYYIGLMSGTSIDAIDAALVELSGPQPELIQCCSHPIPESLRASLKSCYEKQGPTLKSLAIMDKQMGEQFAQAAYTVLEQSNLHASQIRGIGSHGQTIFHLPTGEHTNTIQIGDPNTIAEHTGITTVADFRRRDMAAGGQGAPLVPAFHASLFRSQEHDRVILNIGGIANITILPSTPNLPVTGFDTGPGNGLMDAWIQTHEKQPMDESGHWAASGKVHPLLLEKLIQDDFFGQSPPKSTGREYFNLAWLQKHIKRCPKRILRKDVQATLCELTARTIAEAILQYAPETSEILVCGGGTHNLSLMFRLQHLLAHCKVRSTEDHGMAPDWVEAVAFAWLAKQILEGLPGNLHEVTGASHPVVLGGVYKGGY
jgi:anhydro-N-acetylmuramic acid kinase